MAFGARVRGLAATGTLRRPVHHLPDVPGPARADPQAAVRRPFVPTQDLGGGLGRPLARARRPAPTSEPAHARPGARLKPRPSGPPTRSRRSRADQTRSGAAIRSSARQCAVIPRVGAGGSTPPASPAQPLFRAADGDHLSTSGHSCRSGSRCPCPALRGAPAAAAESGSGTIGFTSSLLRNQQ